jgi:cytochrome c556
VRTWILALAVASSSLAACYKMNTPLGDIPQLKSLEEVMDNQATTIDPQFKKIGQAKFDDAELAALSAASDRVQATSVKTKSFSKGTDFDQLATKLNEKAKALGVAAGAKDANGVNAALTDMKGLCKECHTKFR